MKKLLQEFKEFALKGSVIDLAIGVLIGSAFGSLVTSFTENIIAPLLALLGSTEMGWVIDLGKSQIEIGKFVSDIINFIIMAFIVFMIVKAINKVKSLSEKKVEEAPAAPTTKVCPYCKSEIAIEATKCPHCTSEQPEA